MRLAELDLLAYGKFTDTKLPFPKAEHDFHIIIGPNEAGKSTVRRAITELLFGMEMRSPLGFKHAQSDLRLAGVLEGGPSRLAFIRTKQQKSLRSLSDEVLQESYLAGTLGALTQETFEELHCLDHGRLLRGGQGIVDPKNSVSQILFQAASGLEDFAVIREALGERASALFARTGKNNRFAKASEKFTSAHRTLKDVQVRTKVWVDAREALQAADDALKSERDTRRDLELQRTAWDRARRLAHLIEALGQLQAEEAQRGEVIAFAPGAREALEIGIERVNAASATHLTRQEDAIRAQAAFDAIETNDEILQESALIARLGALCGLHPNHARDLPLRRAEVNAWLAEIIERSEQFGWGSSEAGVRACLPQDKVVRSIDALLKSRGAFVAEERAARDTLAERRTTVETLKEKLAASATQGPDARLVEALEMALPFKASDAKLKALAAAAQSARTSARNALTSLGRPALTEDLLRSLRLPSLERVSGYRQGRQEVVNALELARSLAAQSQAMADGLTLSLKQFERSHQVVTVAQVSDARRVRDHHWAGIKAGGLSLTEGAPLLDTAIRLADELGDSRTRSEADAAEVQALRDQIERAAQEQAGHDATFKGKHSELEALDARWGETAATMGLEGMELDDLPEWLGLRDGALRAADLAQQKQSEYDDAQEAVRLAQEALAQAMSMAGLVVTGPQSVAALCAIADNHVHAANVDRTRRLDLQQQLESAETALRVATTAKEAKEQALLEWTTKWEATLARANLTGLGDDIDEAEAAIRACEFIRQRMERVDTTRSQRIETMEADLRTMQEAAAALTEKMAPELTEHVPEEVFGVLNARLEEAKRGADRKAHARKYLDDALRRRDDAKSDLLQARRSLEPLLAIAGVDEPMLALPLIERWETSNAQQAEISRIQKEIDAHSDGLPLSEIRQEVVSHPADQAADQVLRLRDQLSDSDLKLTSLMANQIQARVAFDTINGGDKAAVAEAERHEALAEMSEVSEEYLQLATSVSLLKWAVDRYRDRKQGPLLDQASEIFRDLTLGAFQKLRVDFEQTPPALVAYRPNSQAVKVSGLSDGTRDQLFLALRIAALELQSDQGTPVPFIADDLFINFDDRRSQAGLKALFALSASTQVIFLSHQEHLLPIVQRLFPQANLLQLSADEVAA
ncbi:YhaN family protein [Acidovorax sp. SUPP3334]|uniref:YhaN family protein n=1 Tax=Acidovorax sp. SUPP3334 TaxID=2920881 RepID=UPI0023DE32C1|nr:YhaN family protein [Acidovorax sp. SUPP3334]GKT26057.1 YhaN family protein [Acidovorax sp. SUPP3334]